MGRKRVYPKIGDYSPYISREMTFSLWKSPKGRYLRGVYVNLYGWLISWGEEPLRLVTLWANGSPFEEQVILKAPTDFLHLTASFCACLVPVGVWTDRFEELFPEQTEVIDFLRRWEERKREIDSYGDSK